MFFFGLFRQLTRIQVRGEEPGKTHPLPVGNFVVGLVVVISAIAIVMGTSHIAFLNWSVVTISALILGGLCFNAFFSGQDAARRLRDMPDWTTPENAAWKADQLRRQAGTLLAQEPASTALSEPPAPVYATLQEVLDDAALNERMIRVAEILIAPCTECGAKEAELCKFVPGVDVYLLDRDRKLVAHGKRIGNAVKLETAKITDVVAQFGNRVPDEVWEAAL